MAVFRRVAPRAVQERGGGQGESALVSHTLKGAGGVGVPLDRAADVEVLAMLMLS